MKIIIEQQNEYGVLLYIYPWQSDIMQSHSIEVSKDILTRAMQVDRAEINCSATGGKSPEQIEAWADGLKIAVNIARQLDERIRTLEDMEIVTLKQIGTFPFVLVEVPQEESEAK